MKCLHKRFTGFSLVESKVIWYKYFDTYRVSSNKRRALNKYRTIDTQIRPSTAL